MVSTGLGLSASVVVVLISFSSVIMTMADAEGIAITPSPDNFTVLPAMASTSVSVECPNTGLYKVIASPYIEGGESTNDFSAGIFHEKFTGDLRSQARAVAAPTDTIATSLHAISYVELRKSADDPILASASGGAGARVKFYFKFDVHPNFVERWRGINHVNVTITVPYYMSLTGKSGSCWAAFRLERGRGEVWYFDQRMLPDAEGNEYFAPTTASRNAVVTPSGAVFTGPLTIRESRIGYGQFYEVSMSIATGTTVTIRDNQSYAGGAAYCRMDPIVELDPGTPEGLIMVVSNNMFIKSGLVSDLDIKVTQSGRETTRVMEDGGPVNVTATLLDQDQNATLNYIWDLEGIGKNETSLDKFGPSISFDPSGLAPADYTISVTALNGPAQPSSEEIHFSIGSAPQILMTYLTIVALISITRKSLGK